MQHGNEAANAQVPRHRCMELGVHMYIMIHVWCAFDVLSNHTHIHVCAVGFALVSERTSLQTKQAKHLWVHIQVM